MSSANRQPLQNISSRSDKSLPVYNLAFTYSEDTRILPAGVPPLSVSERLRARLKRALPRGHQKQLADWSQRPGGRGLTAQEISFFIHPETKSALNRRPIQLDHLDDIASFLRISVGELLGDTKAAELSGDEQRMIYAFRVLPNVTREHFLAVLEQMALAPRVGKLTAAARHAPSGILSVIHSTSSGDAEDADRVPPSNTEVLTAILELRTVVASALAAAALGSTGEASGRQVSGAVPAKAKNRGVAD